MAVSVSGLASLTGVCAFDHGLVFWRQTAPSPPFRKQ